MALWLVTNRGSASAAITTRRPSASPCLPAMDDDQAIGIPGGLWPALCIQVSHFFGAPSPHRESAFLMLTTNFPQARLVRGAGSMRSCADVVSPNSCRGHDRRRVPRLQERSPAHGRSRRRRRPSHPCHLRLLSQRTQLQRRASRRQRPFAVAVAGARVASCTITACARRVPARQRPRKVRSTRDSSFRTGSGDAAQAHHPRGNWADTGCPGRTLARRNARLASREPSASRKDLAHRNVLS